MSDFWSGRVKVHDDDDDDDNISKVLFSEEK